MRCAPALLFCALAGASWLGHVGTARAEPGSDALALAREAYNRGTAAYERGDYPTAARELAAADAIAPDPVTLSAALDVAVLADDAVLGAELTARAARRPAHARLSESLRAARERFAGRTGRVRVTCPGASACAAALDGQPLDQGRPAFARVGRHVVTAERNGRAEERAVEVKPDELTDVVFVEPAPAPAAPPVLRPPERDGLSPAWFFVGLGLTALAGGLGIASAVDTADRHGAFLDAGCAGPVHGDCAALADGGLAAQRRTNVLLGVTAALGAATIAAGVAVSLGVRNGEPIAALRVPLP